LYLIPLENTFLPIGTHFFPFIYPIPGKSEPHPSDEPSYGGTWVPLSLGVFGYMELAYYTGVKIVCTGVIFCDFNLPQCKKWICTGVKKSGFD
jgi:hypothetical protein